MPAPAPSDIERLLTPISAEAPAGASLRHEGTYDKIREMRREDDPSIPQGVWQRPLKIADHNAVVALAVEALELRSKDLQVAAWLADAWTHLFGVQGLARGIELVAGLLTRFWDGLFPELDDDGDADARARVLGWLDDALARRIRLAKLGNERAELTFAEWERADAAGSGDGGAGTTREGLLARMSLVGAPRWAALHGELAAALTAVSAVEEACAARMKDAVALRALAGVLRAMQALVADVLKATGGTTETSGGTVGASEDGGATDVHGSFAPERTGPPGGPITSRAEAYQRLTEAADYLLRTEPHSPVPYLVKRAISWGNLPLALLLQEFIPDANDLVTTHRLLGMRPREE